MTTPSTTIGLSDVNIELGHSSSASISLSASEVRSLADDPSGTISMSDLRNKSTVITAGFRFVFDNGSGSYQQFTVSAMYAGTAYVIYADNATHAGPTGITVDIPKGSSFIINGVLRSTNDAHVECTVTVYNTLNDDVIQTVTIIRDSTGGTKPQI